MVKHLNGIEEQVLESKAWTRDSALWNALSNANHKVPTVEEVCICTLYQLCYRNSICAVLICYCVAISVCFYKQRNNYYYYYYKY